MKKINYCAERCFPYLFSATIVLLMICYKINFISDSNLNDALDGVNTMCALIIGFLGAVLPVILGMKNESKFVKYVFEKDHKKLFLKYIKAVIVIGLITVVITIVMYFRDSFQKDKIAYYLFYVWAFSVILFLLSTYRCLSNMLELIFSDDTKLQVNANAQFNLSEKTEDEIQLENEYKSKP